MNPVLTTTKKIMLKSRSVKIDRAALRDWVDRFARQRKRLPRWETAKHFFDKKNPERSLSYLVMLDTLNFCFWARSGGRWEFLDRGKSHTGYYALALALKAFFKKNPGATLSTFAEMRLTDFRKIFQGGRRLQMMSERYLAARSVARAIIDQGGILSFISSAQGKLSRLVPKIARLPSFADEITDRGKKIYFWKRAQILAGDIAGAFGYRGIGEFQDLSYLTAFADYRVPQILEALGILVYSPRLRQSLANKTLIPSGAKSELEIRANTVWAVEYMRRELRRRGVALMSYQIDWLLWQASQKTSLAMPHHRTRTIFY